MFTIDQLELPRLGLRGLEAGLSEEEAGDSGCHPPLSRRRSCGRWARRLDRMEP